MDDTLNTVKEILQLGFLGFLLFQNKLLWDAYQTSVKAHLEDLKTIAGMREQLTQDARPFKFPTTGSEFAGPTNPPPKLPE